MAKVEIGSVSSGTLRTQDLLEAFANELEWLSDKGAVPPIVAEARRFAELIEEGDTEYEEGADDCLSDLFTYLEELAPPYCYFGAHPGDGADFGFWVIDDAAQQVLDSDGLVVSDLSEVPDDFCGEVLLINDHGNMTLYARVPSPQHRPGFTEVWSIV